MLGWNLVWVGLVIALTLKKSLQTLYEPSCLRKWRQGGLHWLLQFSGFFIYSLYTRYITFMAYCTDICVIPLFYVYIMPRPGIEPVDPWLQVGTVNDWAMRPITLSMFKDIYKLKNVSNYVLFIINRLWDT